MGLLDDAIREHLELKRRRGADPGEVARGHREALDDPLHPEAVRIEDPSSQGSVSAPELASAATASNVPEETAELDMRTVLDQRADSASVEDMSPGSTGAGLPVDGVPEAAAVSGEGVEHVHATVEGVVAQMTDRSHDTSEQDRLWLEPHPPRDVDPDK
jgi:hypothetical protein